MSKKTVSITVGEVEGWTTGDGDPMSHDALSTALVEVVDEVNASGEPATIEIVIAKQVGRPR